MIIEGSFNFVSSGSIKGRQVKNHSHKERATNLSLTTHIVILDMTFTMFKILMIATHVIRDKYAIKRLFQKDVKKNNCTVME